MSVSELWSLLRQVRSLRFEAQSEAGTGWNGSGSGIVDVSEPVEGVIVFEESGTWQPSGQSVLRFTNVFRWTRLGESLRLEHLRFGAENPVFLFDMTSIEGDEWREVSPHLCREDCYKASLQIAGEEIHLAWAIQGPRKSESIRYVYW